MTEPDELPEEPPRRKGGGGLRMLDAAAAALAYLFVAALIVGLSFVAFGWLGGLVAALLCLIFAAKGPSKFCPECRERVKKGARVCKHCGYRFKKAPR